MSGWLKRIRMGSSTRNHDFEIRSRQYRTAQLLSGSNIIHYSIKLQSKTFKPYPVCSSTYEIIEFFHSRHNVSRYSSLGYAPD